ncbi:hypothetical protein L596_017605 [Steinernema carpocapsae]|uniref:Syndecan/Neurexin domain-containing protein n=1 Tax=Steinernema carpocapsae TaxID=34508 RepID=A0A4V6A1U8_STECR|nr:hypothetical protein L596_017605 [Steinernema carpocapsae]
MLPKTAIVFLLLTEVALVVVSQVSSGSHNFGSEGEKELSSPSLSTLPESSTSVSRHPAIQERTPHSSNGNGTSKHEPLDSQEFVVYPVADEDQFLEEDDAEDLFGPYLERHGKGVRPGRGELLHGAGAESKKEQNKTFWYREKIVDANGNTETHMSQRMMILIALLVIIGGGGLLVIIFVCVVVHCSSKQKFHEAQRQMPSAFGQPMKPTSCKKVCKPQASKRRDKGSSKSKSGR